MIKLPSESMTGAEAAEQAVDKAKRAVARPVTPRQDESDEGHGILVSGTLPILGESQGGTTITLAIGTPERLQGPPGLVPALAL
jgi:hypothetical protein